MKSIFLTAMLLSATFSTVSFAQTFNEAAVVDEFYTMQATNKAPETPTQWIQPSNHQEKCAIRSGGSEIIVSAKWYGDCRNGKATGLGMSIINQNGQTKSIIALEEYSGPPSEDDISYRIIAEGHSGTSVFSGKLNKLVEVGQWLRIAKSPQGYTNLDLIRRKCSGGECVGHIADSLTGSITYIIDSKSGYNVSWKDFRVNNIPVYSNRLIALNGLNRATKMIIDGSFYDSGFDLQSGLNTRVMFTDAMNTVLTMPFEKYTSSTGDIDDALEVSNEKFILAYKRFCVGGKIKDEDVKKLCDPSALTPSEVDLTAAKAEANQAVQNDYEKWHNQIVTSRAEANKYAASQAEQKAQQEQFELRKRQQNQQALQQGLNSLNQMGKDFQNAGQQMMNQSNQFKPPQVEQYSPHSPPIVHCRTIGYITTCN